MSDRQVQNAERDLAVIDPSMDTTKSRYAAGGVTAGMDHFWGQSSTGTWGFRRLGLGLCFWRIYTTESKGNGTVCAALFLWLLFFNFGSLWV
jgi:hypothetical protein